MGIAGTTRVYGVIGDPVAHSLSPCIMNRAFAATGLDAAYVAFAVPADRLETALAGLVAAGVAGLNVTYPHKERAWRASAGGSDRAALLRAANTLIMTDGRIRAENTDAPGVALALETFGPRPDGLRALVLGAGGAGRAAALGLLDAGARSVVFAVRDPARAEASLAGLRGRLGLKRLPPVVDAGDRAACERAVRDAAVVIQATPVGLAALAPAAGTEPTPPRLAGAEPTLPQLAAGWVGPGHCCLDLVYHPLETHFLAEARARRAQCLDGLTLLAAQARESFRLWTGREFDLRAMHAALTRGET